MIKMTNRIEILKIVGLKLNSEREVLMDCINASLSSNDPNRVTLIYDSELKLATIEKAIEINNYFQIQMQEQSLSELLDKGKKQEKENK